MVQEALDKLRQQQSKVKARSAPWMVAEQLMEICRREPESAELIARDLENPKMGIEAAEKKLKAFADAHRTGSFSCVTPAEAEGILREFYGLGTPAAESGWDEAAPVKAVSVDLADFF